MLFHGGAIARQYARQRAFGALSRVSIAHHSVLSQENDTKQSSPFTELENNVTTLRTMLRDVISRDPVEGERIKDIIDKFQLLSHRWRGTGAKKDDPAFTEMVELAKEIRAQDLRIVARGFTHFLALSNSAEGHHRVRRLKHRELTNEDWPPKDSVLGTANALLERGDVTADEIMEALCAAKIEIVLTAHPTEVNRRLVIRKHQTIGHLLGELDGCDLSEVQNYSLQRELQRQIESLWWTDEIRRERPDVRKEARQGHNIVIESLWEALPQFLRQLDTELALHPKIGRPLPPQVSPIHFSSWMGGDRDGNPNVTSKVTKEVSIRSRLIATQLVLRSIEALALNLSLEASPQAIDQLRAHMPPDYKPSKQPFKDYFNMIKQRLEAAQVMLNQGALSRKDLTLDELKVEPLTSKDELIAYLMTVHKALVQGGHGLLAEGDLTDLIRQVSSFGLCLLPLDIRQESGRHAGALDAITRHLGLGSYLDWDEETRLSWLQAELNSKRPLLPHGVESFDSLNENLFNADVCDTLETFRLIKQMPSETVGAYVISMAKRASDVLAVQLLQKEAGVKEPMRVVPLFETLDDLTNSVEIMETLWNMPIYRGLSRHFSEVMIGYSDSAKDAGRMAAAWAQYCAQEKLVASAKKHDVDLTFFHGKGGTVSRGGDPSTFRAIAAQPPETVSGRFRITEQGEIITQNYALGPIASRHMNIFTSAILNEQFLPTHARQPKQEWRDLMDHMADVSCDAYRGVVRGNDQFVRYFRTVTPEVEIASLNVGSRPAKRKPGGVETLRAIPWVFAWTQTRFNLTTWLGLGAALDSLTPEQNETLKKMYSEWPWFQAFIDVIDMVLAKTEVVVAENYDRQLLDKGDTELIELGNSLRQELAETSSKLLALRGYETHQEKAVILQRNLRVRNPYVDPLNVLQAETLRRLRTKSYSDDEEARVLEDALKITINGVANGQKNTG